jgi:hypothetical protein
VGETLILSASNRPSGTVGSGTWLSSPGAVWSSDASSVPFSGHTDALVGPTLDAVTAVHVRGIGAVLEVIPARCRQGGLKLLGPFRVGLGQPPDLIGSKAEIAQYLPERLVAVDRLEQLTPHLER